MLCETTGDEDPGNDTTGEREAGDANCGDGEAAGNVGASLPATTDGFAGAELPRVAGAAGSITGPRGEAEGGADRCGLRETGFGRGELEPPAADPLVSGASVGSAAAIPGRAIIPPTPRATASAPTRPI